MAETPRAQVMHEQLEERRIQLLNELRLARQSAEDLQAHVGGDVADRLPEMRVNSVVSELKARELRAIDDVLQMGVPIGKRACEMCKNPIPPSRLRAVPTATRCVACQAAKESTHSHSIRSMR